MITSDFYANVEGPVYQQRCVIFASIAMATFNGAKYLRSQLKDIAGQSVQPHELVVCDDGSHDDTVKILQDFARSSAFDVRIFRNEKTLGYRANFMKAASLCRGEVIFFCDQDDLWHPEKLATVLALFDDPEVLLTYHQARIVDGVAEPTGQILYEGRHPATNGPLCGSPWETPLGLTQAFRSSLLRFTPHWAGSLDPTTEAEPLAHDQWFAFLAGALGVTAFCPKDLLSYRQHGGNTFGMEAFRLTLRQKLVRKLGEAGTSIVRRARSARSRAAVLENIASLTSGAERRRAVAAQAAYTRLAQLCALRADIYHRQRLTQRISALATLAAQGGYGGNPWQFGWGALALDAMLSTTGMRRSGRAS